MPRRPEHDAIQIVAAGWLADEIERRFPGFVLVMLPPHPQREGDLPAYILAATGAHSGGFTGG